MTATEIGIYIGALIAAYIVGLKVGVVVKLMKGLGNQA